MIHEGPSGAPLAIHLRRDCRHKRVCDLDQAELGRKPFHGSILRSAAFGSAGP